MLFVYWFWRDFGLRNFWCYLFMFNIKVKFVIFLDVFGGVGRFEYGFIVFNVLDCL